MSLSKHLKLSVYTIADSKHPEPIETSCVVSFSNYCWYDKLKDSAPKLAKCAKKDFDISFKLSSTAFKTSRNADADYHFDKQGVKLTYNQCYTLFRSEEFVVEFLEKIKKYYDRDLNLNVASAVDESQPYDVQELAEEDEENQLLLKRKPIKNSIQDYSVKKMKKNNV